MAVEFAMWSNQLWRDAHLFIARGAFYFSEAGGLPA
jgi:hypothetical protein